jgi:hypothetical protein
VNYFAPGKFKYNNFRAALLAPLQNSHFKITEQDASWERSFQFRPFAVDVFGACGDGATAILQQLARKRSEHTSMTVGACKRLAFQSLSVALQTANARMLRSRKAFVSPLSLLPKIPGAAS